MQSIHIKKALIHFNFDATTDNVGTQKEWKFFFIASNESSPNKLTQY